MVSCEGGQLAWSIAPPRTLGCAGYENLHQGSEVWVRLGHLTLYANWFFDILLIFSLYVSDANVLVYLAELLDFVDYHKEY